MPTVTAGACAALGRRNSRSSILDGLCPNTDLRGRAPGKRSSVRLTGLRRALADQVASTPYADLTLDERIGLLVDHEWRDDWARGLERRQALHRAGGEWIRQRQTRIVSGPTGVGMTQLGCAPERSVCKAGFVVRCKRLRSLIHRIRQAQDACLPARAAPRSGSNRATSDRRLAARSSDRGPSSRSRRDPGRSQPIGVGPAGHSGAGRRPARPARRPGRR